MTNTGSVVLIVGSAANEFRPVGPSSPSEDSRTVPVSLRFSSEAREWLEQLTAPVELYPADVQSASRLAEAILRNMQEQHAEGEVDHLREKLRAVRIENSQLERRLAERKIIERAKGILQVQFTWTEEEAYYHIRRTSRQQRTPMVTIARRIIGSSAEAQTGIELLSA